ncbi:drug/metabolite transporter (DMT)-like permease [Paenibacillus turicensis]|uniref:Drug/metabolite transporter (DMT)-like permease n=1 Tax=Paenibacillus turicensis TaxID=160487 RepID=A0ABS4FYX9_9BACL|nr:EamA family transporter [Paenibacillus turicensis]MBP1907776.1 drug/metabolite transporter (DMT)-like permease [Paenibacillus turicensis]
MEKAKLISYGMLLGNIVLLVTGQVLFKLGLQRAGGFVWQKMITSPLLISGLALYGIATILWFGVLTRLPLSQAYPMQALAYVIALLPAYFLFGEIITMTKLAGVAVILVGVYLLAR